MTNYVKDLSDIHRALMTIEAWLWEKRGIKLYERVPELWEPSTNTPQISDSDLKGDEPVYFPALEP